LYVKYWKKSIIVENVKLTCRRSVQCVIL